MADDLDGVTPDFTVQREPRRFRLGGVDYVTSAFLSVTNLRKVAALAAKGDLSSVAVSDLDEARIEQLVALVGDAFALLVPGRGGREIRARLLGDLLGDGDDGDHPEGPIDFMGEAMPCFTWLMGVYIGGRPTPPRSSSASGSAATEGEPALTTDGALPEASDT